MQKVNLITVSQGKLLKEQGKEVINNFYAGKDAVVVSQGEKDGVYYVKNFPKDLQYKLKEDDNKELINRKGFCVNDKDIFKNNILIKKKNMQDVYIVKPLDSLTSVCSKLNINEEELMLRNQLKTKNLFVGQRLIIDV